MAEGAHIASLWLVGLCGGIVGAAIVLSLRNYRMTAAAKRDGMRERISAWLAAYVSVSRASVSFVAAFRLLAAESKPSQRDGLRRHEAQRVRAQWVQAVEKLDVAEAKIRVWHADTEIVELIDQLPRVSVASMRTAIDGDEADADRFIHAVTATQREAATRMASLANAKPASLIASIAGRIIAKVQGVIDTWASK